MFVLNVVKILLIFVVVCTVMKKKSKKALVIKRFSYGIPRYYESFE